MGRHDHRADKSPNCTNSHRQGRLGQQWESTKGRLEATLSELDEKDTSDLPEELRALEKLLYNTPDKD